ncbi:membrane protein insertase YidC [Bacillus shivajii]|uniref:membrane protein insertase YidC n=1 Tax=Bacillus shivajii TaxID=1983719 RepID=UPI001CFAE72E|nr:membrane protein insertase YidC [Bacillus shivajii]UCZ53128.1 membrane protein insertase YidC [Bacillus shivajii]
MEKSSVFTHFKTYGLLIVTTALLFLSGCQASSEPIDANTTGVFNHYVIYPFSYLLKFFASMFDGNYGLSIILMTLMLRVSLMPLMMKQYKNQMHMREKMSVIQPEVNKVKEKYKEKKDRESQQKMQKEMMELYQKHNFNPLTSMGCLPMMIQFPILIGFYYAIMRTPEIAEHSFLWFSLGETDSVLPFIAALVYLVQFKISQIGMDPQQQKQLAAFGYITPIIMGVFSFSVPAALPLYWSVGGLFLIFQTLVSKSVYKQNSPVGETLSQK